MKSIKKMHISVLVAVTALALSACGGGGSSGTANNSSASANSSNTRNATVSRLTGVNGFTVNYNTSSASSATGWSGQVASPVTYTSVTDINSFVVADAASTSHTYSYSGANVIKANQFAFINGTSLGGTNYIYSRFGSLYGSTTETNGTATDWYTPFALASTTPASPTNLSYTGAQQALVYLEGDKGSGVSGGISGYATCDTSASYTASSKTLQLTLSNCTTGVSFDISGGLILTNGTGTSTLTAHQTQGNLQTLTSVSVDSGNFLLAGPNGEELVGAATIKGTIGLTNGTGGTKPAIALIIFGGKKQ